MGIRDDGDGENKWRVTAACYRRLVVICSMRYRMANKSVMRRASGDATEVPLSSSFLLLLLHVQAQTGLPRLPPSVWEEQVDSNAPAATWHVAC